MQGTVLVVDDEPGIREVLRRTLVAAGYHVWDAAGPIEACHIFMKEQIDAVILDLRMPELPGFNLLEWLRTEPSERMQTLPVLVLTGHALTDVEKETLRRQHAEVFYKPLAIREIVNALARVVA